MKVRAESLTCQEVEMGEEAAVVLVYIGGKSFMFNSHVSDFSFSSLLPTDCADDGVSDRVLGPPGE